MANVASATKHFPVAQEGFTTTTSGSVSSGATTVGLNSVSGYTNGDPVVLVIDPSDATKKQVFTGIVDTSGVQITSVVWTEGTNQAHSAGATVVDYTAATHQALLKKGIEVEHAQDGTHTDVTATSVDTDTLVVNTGTTLPAGDIVTADLADSAVTTAKINDGAVTADKLATGAGADRVDTAQTTTSTSYTDLSTAGPAVTVTIGANGLALVILGALIDNSTSGFSFISFVASGANTIAAADNNAALHYNTNDSTVSRVILLTGLSAGSTTFTAKYKVNSGTGTFTYRTLAVVPL